MDYLNIISLVALQAVPGILCIVFIYVIAEELPTENTL